VNILYVNVHNVDYPRNRLIRSSLEAAVHDIDVVTRHDMKFFLAECARLLWICLFRRSNYDVVVLSVLFVQYAPVARIIAWRFNAPLVVDMFVRMYETNVGDWQRVSRRSIRARLYKSADSFAVWASDVLLTDTDVRAEALGAPLTKKVFNLPVGAPTWASPTPLPSVPRINVLYYGNYIALHGLEYVVRGLARRGVDDLDIVFIGEGELRPKVEDLAISLGLAGGIKFVDSVPERQLASAIGAAHVVLGVFGSSEKAASVIANKVWQGLACGRYVVTRESAALEEIRNLVSDALVTVDIQDEDGLSAALAEVRERITSGRIPNVAVSGDLQSYTEERYNEFVSFMSKVA